MITAFLPCRKGSERIPNKNIKPFAGYENGLLEIKMAQLLACSYIDRIVLSSNDERVLEYGRKINLNKITIDKRPDYLGNSKTSTDELIAYVPSIIESGDVLWTHVTSPFIAQDDYDKAIEKYQNLNASKHDSLMSVKEIKGFIWSHDAPVSYDRSLEKWPRTQTIESLFEIDSGIFLNSIDNYKKHQDRIGERPFMYVQEELKSLDIDWPDQFDLAENIFINSASK